MPNNAELNSKDIFTPDVLDCIANLSSDEVFTPPKLVNKVLDLLPPEIWHNKEATFLDPACKSGVWLREITKRLISGLADEIPDLQERIDHVLHKQVFGIAITELTSLLSRRSLYCSKYPNGKYSISSFDDVSGNIWFKNLDHRWKNGKCELCGASQAEYDRSEDKNSYAYGFIHCRPEYWEEVFGVKFDVIIGNPPYQLDTGGGAITRQAKPIYQLFVEQAMRLRSRYVIMITPSRWLSGGMGLDDYRQKMLNSRHIKHMTDFSMSSQCFPGVDIAGGVSYFMWDRDYNGACNYTYVDGDKTQTQLRDLGENSVFVRDNFALQIIRQVRSRHEESIASIMSSLGPFGISSAERGVKTHTPDSYVLMSSAGKSYIAKSLVPTGNDYIDKWKVVIGKATSAGAATADKNGQRKVLATLDLLEPDSVCTFSYFLGGAFDSKDEAENCRSYYATKFVRFLLLQCLSSINLSRDKFQFVPIQDFSKPWIDKELYAKYNLSNEEINYIESAIKEME